MYLLIAIVMIITGLLFLVKASRMKFQSGDISSLPNSRERLAENFSRQKKSLRKMGIMSIILGLALILVDSIYVS